MKDIINKKLRGQPKEDQVTSALLSPFSYTNPKTTTTFLFNAFKKLTENEISMSPDSFSFKFWPKYPSGHHGHTVEPDVVVEFTDKSSNMHWLITIEIKWDSPLSGDGQLIRQWISLRKFYDKPNTYFSQLLITKDRESGRNGKKTSKQYVEKHLKDKKYIPTWCDNFRAKTWQEMAMIFRDTETEDKALDALKNDFYKAIETLIERSFTGFKPYQIPRSTPNLKLSFFSNLNFSFLQNIDSFRIKKSWKQSHKNQII